MSSQPILAIDEAKFVAVGGQRIVYIHPEDASKVVKVFREDRTPAMCRAKRRYGPLRSLRRFDQNETDYRQYRRVAKKVGQPPQCLYTIFGYVETTRGRGLVTEHVCNEDGQTSGTIADFVERHGTAPIYPLLDGFFEDLAAHHVVVREAHKSNILVREGDGATLKLVIIDGLGDPNIIPFATISKTLNRRRLMRKKQNLIRSLAKVAKQGSRSKSFRASRTAAFKTSVDKPEEKQK